MKLAWPKPVAAEQRPPCSEGGVPLPAARSGAREGGSGAAAQGVVASFCDGRAQLLQHLGGGRALAAPELEGLGRLFHQHSQAVARLVEGHVRGKLIIVP